MMRYQLMDMQGFKYSLLVNFNGCNVCCAADFIKVCRIRNPNGWNIYIELTGFSIVV